MTDRNSQPTKVTNKIHEQNKILHDEEAEIYDQIRGELWNFWEQRRIFQDIEKIDRLIPQGKVADIGCGTGNITPNSMEILAEDKYTPWKSGIVSAAGELINLDRPTDFKLLARKSGD